MVVLAFLCLFLFAWGTGYKLSLYRASENHKPTMAAAKLLSQKERPAASIRLRVHNPHGKPMGVGSHSLLMATIALSIDIDVVSMPTFVRAAKQSHNTPAFYSRPPPRCA
jgi:hypothetical protein